MTISQIANLMSIPIGAICLIICARAFYIYSLSRNDMLFVLGVAMASIGIGTLFGTVGEAHLWGNNLHTDWARTFGACSGGLFIFLSSLTKSKEQIQQLRRWQLVVVGLFVIVAVFTPFYPPTSPVSISLTLNSLRIIIYTCAFVRYAILYRAKTTRFSLIMCIGFLVLVLGYGLNIPGIFLTSLAIFTIFAAIVRIVAYITLLVAYSAS